MARNPRRSRNPETPAGSPKSVDKELEDAEREAAESAGGSPVATEEEQAQEEGEPQEESNGDERGTRRRGKATVSVVARGDADAVREAMASMNQRPVAVAKETLTHEDVDKFAGLLQNPRYMVVVSRLHPTSYLGVRCPVRLEKYPLPNTLDDICADIFRRFGGKRFKVAVHPNKTTGESVLIDAIAIENPDSDIPLHEGEPIAEPPEEEVEAVDPTIVEDNDASAQLEKTINDQIKMTDRILKLKSSKRLLKELDNTGEDDAGRTRREDQSDERFRQLEERITIKNVEDRMEKRMDQLAGMIESLAKGGGAARGGDGESGMMKFMLQMQQNSQQQFQTMMTTMMGLLTSNNKKHDDLDSQLDRLSKLRNVFGEGDSRLKSIESKLLNVAFDRLLDGGGDMGGEPEDLGKVAIKELSPILKTFVEAKVAQAEAPPQGQITQDQYKKHVQAEAQKIALGIAKDWEQKGYLVKLPDNRGLPAPKASPAPAPTTQAPPPPKQEPPKEEEEEVDTPPSPQSPKYDRRAAVQFVLEVISEDIKTQNEDTYAVGDILDRLDDELLGGMLSISTGPELEALLAPHADPKLLEEIKAEAKKSPAAEEWLQKTILTAKSEYRKQVGNATHNGEKPTEAK